MTDLLPQHLSETLSIFLHLDQHLQMLISQYGVWTYLILFLIIFCETGLVITPFLPGDSLLFIIGALAASGFFHIPLLIGLLLFAAILGDTVNYSMGKHFGEKIFSEKSRFFKMKYLKQTKEFYEKHGPTTIIIARFVPIIRTFAPFVAGIGSMKYSRFMNYNVVGAFLWVISLVFLGYFFGNLPWVKSNLSMVTMGIIFISLLPGVWHFLKNFLKTHSLRKEEG